MTRSAGFAIGMAAASVAVGGWRVLLPGTTGASEQVARDLGSMLDTVTSARFTGAEATLEQQRRSTGSYAGAPVTPPIVLARADAGSYCIQLVQGRLARHVRGPGGAPEPGPC